MYGDNKLEITVNKEDLLTKLRANRNTHEATYQEAKAGFIILLRQELESKLSALNEGTELELHFKNRKPEKHTDDYDEVIEMLEMEVDEEVVITHTQFKQWVKDQWDWRSSFDTSNSVYLSAAAGQA